ncbi:MAG: hypothetical protein JO002_18225 [Burkholderiaceae bacterium]|nr:hypothetical protein [Burkholderiaceae bacterium]
MKNLLGTLTVVAVFGLLLSLVLHICGWFALAGMSLLSGDILHALAPWVMRLGIVGLPALALAALAAYHAGSRDVLRVVLAPAPRWLRVARVALLLYGFGFFVVLGIVWHHESAPNLAHATLFGSSLGLAFYGTCVAVLFSMLRAPQMLAPQRCPKGHAVPGGEEICPDCGERVEPRS